MSKKKDRKSSEKRKADMFQASLEVDKLIEVGIIFVAANLFTFLILKLTSYGSIKIVCAMFLASAFGLTEIVNKKFPAILESQCDKKTPMTSSVLGSKITRCGMTYFLVEALIAAVCNNKGNVNLNLVFFIQAAAMIVYLSYIAYYSRVK